MMPPLVPSLWPMGSGLVMVQTLVIRPAEQAEGQPSMLGVVRVRACPDGYSEASGRPAAEAWEAAEATADGPIELQLAWESAAKMRDFARLLDALASEMETDNG